MVSVVFKQRMTLALCGLLPCTRLLFGVQCIITLLNEKELKMSVKFEFTLSDIDASNLIDIIQQDICRTRFGATEFIKTPMTATDQANLDWHNKHAEYLEGLKQKVLSGNKRVEE